MVIELFGYLQMMPLLIYCSRYAPLGLEATTLAGLTAIPTTARSFNRASTYLTTWALHIDSHHFNNLTEMIIICTLACLIPLPVLPWIPADAGVFPEDMIDDATVQGAPAVAMYDGAHHMMIEDIGEDNENDGATASGVNTVVSDSLQQEENGESAGGTTTRRNGVEEASSSSSALH